MGILGVLATGLNVEKLRVGHGEIESIEQTRSRNRSRNYRITSKNQISTGVAVSINPLPRSIYGTSPDSRYDVVHLPRQNSNPCWYKLLTFGTMLASISKSTR